MGQLASTLIVLGPGLEEVVDVVDGDAFVAVDGDTTVVFVNDDAAHVVSGEDVAMALGCTVVEWVVYDGDLLGCTVYRDRQRVYAGVWPDPREVFGDAVEAFGITGEGEVGTADELVGAVGRGDVDAVDDALANLDAPLDEQHRAMLAALGLPTWPAGWSYDRLHHEPTAYPGPRLHIVRTSPTGE